MRVDRISCDVAGQSVFAGCARFFEPTPSLRLQLTHCRLGQRAVMCFLVMPGEQLARIPKAFRRIVLHQTGGESDCFRCRFEESIELPKRDLALLCRSRDKGYDFSDRGMALALTALPRSTAI